MAGCMVFVFAALSEFVVVKVLDESYKTRKKQEQKAAVVICFLQTNKYCNTTFQESSVVTPWHNNLNKMDIRNLKRPSQGIVQVCWTNVTNHKTPHQTTIKNELLSECW